MNFNLRSKKDLFNYLSREGLKTSRLKEYEKIKYEDKIDFIDLKVRNSFPKNKVTISMIKYAYGFNYYSRRDKIINKHLISDNCLRCSYYKI